VERKTSGVEGALTLQNETKIIREKTSIRVNSVFHCLLHLVLDKLIFLDLFCFDHASIHMSTIAKDTKKC
jgi:hypothetical protein